VPPSIELNPAAPDRIRLKACLRGAVQGVGFRPFLFRIASELGLSGWITNTVEGVLFELEGPRFQLEALLLRIEAEKPPRSFIQSLEPTWLDAAGYAGLEIRESRSGGVKSAIVLPDAATCPDCIREIFDPANRRYRYPFTNCTHCGPRFSIIESLPYDRANTSMKQFAMCPRCRAEYDDPRDRRFHAQPNACPDCGPQLELWQADEAGRHAGLPQCRHHGHDALAAAAAALRSGRILSVKGLGGFHLMASALDDAAVRRLRERKHREEKPFALMFPSLDAVKAVCRVSGLEERLLRSPEAPIVLLARIPDRSSALAGSIAPGNPNLGAMLPYTPLHHLLMSLLEFPVVATSGNRSDEPICIDAHEAFERLAGIADLFLVHNRPIVRHVDDSVVRVMMDRELVLRRARGYAPLPIALKPEADGSKPGTILAVGAHLKNAVALAIGPQAFISQHIGDLETNEAFEAFQKVIADFQKLYDAYPQIVAADAHPDYLSTKFASGMAGESAARAADGAPGSRRRPGLIRVQHHIAHVLSCMGENELSPPALGVAWDGTGYGSDGTVWGGEFFLVSDSACRRAAHLRTFRLPGGDKAVKEPRRAALGLLYEACGEAAFEMRQLPPLVGATDGELSTVKNMLARGLNSPRTSSAGRLFDAVASLIGLRQTVHFEGQAAMELEFALEGIVTEDAYPVSIEAPGAGGDSGAVIGPQPPLILDWAPMIQAILSDRAAGVSAGRISATFHNALAEAVVEVARRVGQSRVVLSGGCFQNRYLAERTVRRLREAGFRPYWHQRVPPNDGGIALGQIIAARRPSFRRCDSDEQ
jgi:hydrogenase maturation protein HypF